VQLACRTKRVLVSRLMRAPDNGDLLVLAFLALIGAHHTAVRQHGPAAVQGLALLAALRYLFPLGWACERLG
jgi:hypothetical protein